VIKTERLEKGLRLGQVGDREVEEYLFVHGDGLSRHTFNERTG
jgi:hypothetical protein